MGALGIGPRLVADGLEAVDAILERRVVDVRNGRLYGIVSPLEAKLGFGGAPVQLGDVLPLSLAARLPAVEHGGEDGFQSIGLEQTVFQMAGDKIVQPLHRHRHACAAGRPLPGPGRAGIVAVAPALAGADGHGTAAPGAVDQAGQQRRPGDDGRWCHRRVPGFEQRLHRVEGRAVDDRRDGNDHDLAGRVQRLVLAAPVELMLAHVGAPCQDAVDLADAPETAITREDAVAVEMADDVLHAHLAGCAVAFEGETIDQPHGVGVERVDLQLLLDLRPARLGGDCPVADGGQRAVPEALPGILLQRPHDVLGVLLRLILVEQRHDLAHHHVHRIVAHLLGDRDKPHAVLGQLPDVELQLEVIAEEAAERVDDHHVERRGLRGAGFDHALELGPPVVGGRRTRLHERFDELKPARLAISFALALLVGG